MRGRCGRSPRGHGGAGPPGRHGPRQQDRGCSHFLPVNLASVHVSHGLFGVSRVLKLYVGEAPRQVAVRAVGGQLDTLHGPVAAKDLQQVVACHVARQPAHVDLAGTRGRGRPLTPAAATARGIGGGSAATSSSSSTTPSSPSTTSSSACSTRRLGGGGSGALLLYGLGCGRSGRLFLYRPGHAVAAPAGGHGRGT